jgi:hypothetical protein
MSREHFCMGKLRTMRRFTSSSHWGYCSPAKEHALGYQASGDGIHRKLLVAMQNIGLKRSTADPCLYYKWERGSLVIMISWIHNNTILGPEDLVMQVKANLRKQFKCDQ